MEEYRQQRYPTAGNESFVQGDDSTPITHYRAYQPPEASKLLRDGAINMEAQESTQSTPEPPPHPTPLRMFSERSKTSVNFVKRWHKSNNVTPFTGYGIAILLVFFGSLGFWIHGKRKPIFYSRANTKWMIDNPKSTTIIWSAAASLVAWYTTWLYACAVSLMARKHILRHGAKISTIEDCSLGLIEFKAWVKLGSQGALLNKNRPLLSVFTVFAAIITALLTVGFMALLTPVPIRRAKALTGTEVDFTSPEFLAWYKQTTNRTVSGCKWWTHKNPLNESKQYTFPTCPFADDTSLFLQAGRAAVEQGFGMQSTTKVGDVNFNGTTGGTLPAGRNGFIAFDNVHYDEYQFIDKHGISEPYNYSALIQGSTVEVKCEQKQLSPIQEHLLLRRDTIKSQNKHVNYTLSANMTEGKCTLDEAFNFIVPGGGNLMSFFCGPDKNDEYSFFFRPFGDYETGARGLQLQNLTCDVKPRMTIVNSTYTSIRNEFSSEPISYTNRSGLSPTDREAMDAIFQIFWYGISIQGNVVADAVLSLRYQSHQNRTQTVAETFEQLLKGLYEMEMTALRLYYSANSPPGIHNITGNLTYIRLGYNGTVEAVYALIPLALVSATGLGFLIWGLMAGGELSKFNPTHPSSLIYASSQGGLVRQFDATDVADPSESTVKDVKLRFGELPEGKLGLGLEVEVTRPTKGKDYTNRDSMHLRSPRSPFSPKSPEMGYEGLGPRASATPARGMLG
ncbi:hypothetical protein L873DRAFT_1790320 [Choiromyces venosus 120613-1]|uniref:Uncharacterized protein n=1 Tax=Choiromyces venosus 120613-1 TaxID=1336337 RepID=A0A3N4JNI1_9PEZI|nr:hypothetical protein L873DRAFT_1790320 [Choiromyces venosus 120613-1]